MGCLSAKVNFLSTPPTLDALVAALCHHTNEVVSYDAERGELICAASGDTFSALSPHVGHLDWQLITFNLSGGYLWHASLVVLQVLGGAYARALPVWAYKPWAQAQHEYEQEEYTAPRYTYAEARRLGIPVNPA